MDRAYGYDPIGNRTASRRGTDPNSLYQSNSLNQYLRIDLEGSDLLGQRFWHDPDGNLEAALAAGDADADGDVDQEDVDLVLWYYDTPLPAPGDPNRPIYLRCDFSGNSYVDQDDIDILLFQFGEQYSSTLVAQFTWDGENRLIGWGPVTPQAGSKKLDFRYDYRNRRVEKRVSTFSGSAWAVSDVRRFVWSDWLPLAELRGDPNDPNEPNKYKVERYYTWGLDLAGLSGAQGGVGVSPAALQGAGGIGGLLACRDPNDPNDPNDLYGDFLYFFDGNGNVGQLVDAAGSATAAPVLAAKYEYDPYGNTLRAPGDANSGPYAAANPVRFSTKAWDDETGLGNWGERYYDGMRWLSRDLLRDLGSLLLRRASFADPPAMRTGARDDDRMYHYAANDPTLWVDPFGLCPVPQPGEVVWGAIAMNPSPKYFNMLSAELAVEMNAHGAIAARLLKDACCPKIGVVQIVRESYDGRAPGAWVLDTGWTDKPLYPKSWPRPPAGTWAFGFRDQPGWDPPGDYSNRTFTHEFETCVVCICGQHTFSWKVGCVLGCITWSYSYTLNPTPPPPHNITMRVTGCGTTTGAPTSSGGIGPPGPSLSCTKVPAIPPSAAIERMLDPYR